MVARVPFILPPQSWKLVDEHERTGVHHLHRTVLLDHLGRGAVARRADDGSVWRAEDGPEGPLLLMAAQNHEHFTMRAWAPADSGWDRTSVRDMAQGWAGFADSADGIAHLLDDHPLLSRVARRFALMRLSRLPNVQEAIGRGVIGQLVQVAEANRSTAQLTRHAGSPIGPLHAWPTTARLATMPVYEFHRHCGLSQRSARAIAAATMMDAPLRRHAAASDWGAFDARLRSIPGIGVWTSGEARAALGDPDAVSFGDYHLPRVVGNLLGGDEPEGGWNDSHLEALLEPFRPHRARVIRLLLSGVMNSAVRGSGRRAPHAAVSAHRYW